MILYKRKMVYYFFYEDFSQFIFSVDPVGILGVNLDQINLNDDNNFDKGDTDIIIHLRIFSRLNKFVKRIILKGKISKDLMPVASHPKRW